MPSWAPVGGAHLQRVVDGNALAAVVDLGLGHRAFPRLRLRAQADRRPRDVVTTVPAQVDVVVVAADQVLARRHDG